MSDIATALLQALGLSKGSAPEAPPNTSAQPWNDPSLAAPPVKPQMAAGGMGGPVAQGGSGSSDRDNLDALLAEIVKQKQMAAGATGNPIPR